MGAIMDRSAHKAENLLQSDTDDKAFLENKIKAAAFYKTHLLPLAFAHKQAVINGAVSVTEMSF